MPVRTYFAKSGKERMEKMRVVVNCLAALTLPSRAEVLEIQDQLTMDQKVVRLSDFVSRQQIDIMINLISNLPIDPDELVLALEHVKTRCLR